MWVYHYCLFQSKFYFFPAVGHCYVQIAISLALIGNFEQFFQILKAGVLLFQGCSYGNLALGREGVVNKILKQL